MTVALAGLSPIAPMTVTVNFKVAERSFSSVAR